MKNKKFVATVLGICFLHLMIFVIIPMVGSLGIGFFDFNPLSHENKFVGLDNFVKMASDQTFFRTLGNTLIFVTITVVLNICLSLLIAQAITRFKSNKTRSFFRVVFFMPCVAPLVAAALIWKSSLLPTKSGLVNLVLTSLNLEAVPWLSDPTAIMIALVVFTLWADIGYNIIIFSAGMDAIPNEFYEAAKLDGASEWKRFTRITLPLLSRTFAFVSVMTVISHFQMFAQFYVMIIRNMQLISSVLMNYIYRVAFEGAKDIGYAASISLVLFIIIFIITMIQRRLGKNDWEY